MEPGETEQREAVLSLRIALSGGARRPHRLFREDRKCVAHEGGTHRPAAVLPLVLRAVGAAARHTPCPLLAKPVWQPSR